VISHTTELFRKLLADLRKETQRQAREAYAQFKKKTLIIQGYTSNGYIQSGRSMQFAFKEIIVLWA